MSTPAAPPLWTPAQQSWLQAMGYTVFVDGSVDAAPDAQIDLGAVPATALPDDPVVVPGSARHSAPAPRRSAPTSIEDASAPAHSNAPTDDAPAPPRRGAPAAEAPAASARSGARRPAVRMPPPLQIALLRASGCNPNDPDTQALMAGWNLDELRGNAAAKRALWPQLRALRKRGRA
ncbi:DNA polymerase III subunit psi [Paracidovorax citrulli]